jgi:hypothetical protein
MHRRLTGRNGSKQTRAFTDVQSHPPAAHNSSGFYDVWVCSVHPDFNSKTLLEPITATFENRQTPIPAEEPQAFSAHRIQWNAFVKKIGEEHLTYAFVKVIEDLGIFCHAGVPRTRERRKAHQAVEG